MPTTTIRLTEDLKVRIAAAADRVGMTAQSFVVDAIARRVTQLERQAAFNDLGQQRYAAIAASGETIAWAEMRRYLEACVAGQSPAPPKARTPDQ